MHGMSQSANGLTSLVAACDAYTRSCEAASETRRLDRH